MPDPFAGAITQGRALYQKFAMPDECTILRVTETQTAGGTTETTTVVARDVPCRYSEDLTQQDLLLAERRGLVLDASLALPALTDITAADRVTELTVGGVMYGTRNANGDFVWDTYEVAAVQRASRETHRTALLRKT